MKIDTGKGRGAEMIGIFESFCLYVVCFSLSCQVLGMNITNKSGKVYQDVKIKKIKPTGLYIHHSKGISLLPFKTLSKEIQNKYGYDPSKEMMYLENERKANVRKRQIDARKRQIDAVQKTGTKVHLEVIQMLDVGFLASGYYYEKETYTDHKTIRKTRPHLQGSAGNHSYQIRIPVEKTRTQKHTIDRFFVVGSFNNIADGDSFELTIYPCGTYTYPTVSGSTSTVKRFAANPEIALKLLYRYHEKNENSKTTSPGLKQRRDIRNKSERPVI